MLTLQSAFAPHGASARQVGGRKRLPFAEYFPPSRALASSMQRRRYGGPAEALATAGNCLSGSLTLSGTIPTSLAPRATSRQAILSLSRRSGKAAKAETPGRTYNEFPGGHRRGVTPVPIPNTEVKLSTADGTAWVTVWESRSLPGLFLEGPLRKRGAFFYC